MAKLTSYIKHPQSICAEDGSKLSDVLNTAYDNVEFNLATGQSDYDVKASVAGAFSNVATARIVNIRTNQTISVKFNSTSNASITIASTDSPFSVRNLETTNLYITNASGSTAAIKILLI